MKSLNRTPQVRSFYHRSSPSFSDSTRTNIAPSFTTSLSSDFSSSTITGNRLYLAPTISARFVCVNSQGSEDSTVIEEDDDDEAGFLLGNVGNWAIVSSCLVGLLTGIGVVAFNNGVHELRDLFWDGIPSRGASWLREAPIEGKWARVILVPACGGLVVGMLNWLRSSIESEDGDRAKAVLRPILKAVAACVTLGTGNSLGPEGPSVEIGASVAKGVGNLFDRSPKRKNSLVAAGSAAGISSGFNAAVAGCFFAVESVLWPSTEQSSLSLSNTTSAVILSAVIASIVSEVGLGSEPAFKVPVYDFRSPGEIPLYLLLGAICGLVSLALSRCTSYMLTIADSIHESTPILRAAFPFLGGLSVGLIALAYPEILYWGFENVDILIESRPFVKGLSAELLIQLVVVKIIATSLCRASGLVGGYYAPSLFIGAATGTAYGKLISLALAQSNSMIDFSLLEVASPQAYGLVGMAATLAGVCQVPLTSVLLLFELTQDYRIVLPLLGAVGLSSWVTSGQSKRKDVKKKLNEKNKKINSYEGNTQPPNKNRELSSASQIVEQSSTSSENNLCEVESSLCLEDSGGGVVIEELEKRTFVSQAMRTRYVTVLLSTSLSEAVALMLVEKQACAVIVDSDNILVGLLSLEKIEEFSRSADRTSVRSKEVLVSELCSFNGGKCRVPWTVLPSMNLLHARILMEKHGLSRVAVILENVDGKAACPVGILDRESISLTCSVGHSLPENLLGDGRTKKLSTSPDGAIVKFCHKIDCFSQKESGWRLIDHSSYCSGELKESIQEHNLLGFGATLIDDYKEVAD